METHFSSSGGEAAGAAMGLAVILIAGFFALLMLALTVLVWWKIFSKAGYSGAMGLLMLVPLVNFVMILILAFGQWPIHRELEQLKQYRSPPGA